MTTGVWHSGAPSLDPFAISPLPQIGDSVCGGLSGPPQL